MATAEKTMLDGTVEMDETYLGGRLKGNRKPLRKYRICKKVDCDRDQTARTANCDSFRPRMPSRGTLAKYIKENISQDVEVIMTDELPAYPGAIVKPSGMKDVPTKRSTT